MVTNVAGVTAPGMSAMVSGASTRASPQQKMTKLFNQIDSSGSGSITQAQFTQAFQTMNPPGVFKAAGSSAVWNYLDPNNTGQVSQQTFVNGMKQLMVQLRQPSSGATASAATQSLNQISG
jgi:Ca2+-binding EF-hand superfamily protein